MTNPIITSYLDDPYLDGPYLVNNVVDHYGVQSSFRIDVQKALAVQAKAIINGLPAIGTQSRLNILDYPNPLAEQALLGIIAASPIGAQITAIIAASEFTAAQIEAVLIKDHALGIQAKFSIIEKLDAFGVQSLTAIADSVSFIGVQSQAQVNGSDEIGIQVEAVTEGVKSYHGVQSQATITDQLTPLGSQSNVIINGFGANAYQAELHLNKTKDVGVQSLTSIINRLAATGIQVRADKSFPHHKCTGDGYLVEDYLTGPYLGPSNCVSGPVEINLILKKQPSVGLQSQLVLKKWTQVAVQIRTKIADRLRAIGIQFQSSQAYKLGIQFTAVLYNVTNLRVMYTFPSRGTTGENWVASSTETGDFDVNNINSDLVEQRYQSAAGITTISLECDTELVQGIAVDTAAILSHNLTTSASVVLEGSSDPLFSSINESIPMTVVAGEDVYYIAPEYPTMYSRYWRLQVSDVTNPDACIKIGTVIFGSSVVLQGENFTDTVRKRKTHFADSVKTEGFSAASNDRALKKAVTLDFRDIQYGRGNYKNLEYIFDYARTSLKCLWIPDPRRPSRYAVFGKLSQMPDEEGRNMGEGADLVNFTVDVDESI